MPRGNRRGPVGLGKMTGRGLGYCAGNSSPGCGENWRIKRRFRNGGRFKRGFANRAGAAYGPAFEREVEAPAAEKVDYSSEEAKNDEIARLENLAKRLSNNLKSIENKIEEMKNKI